MKKMSTKAQMQANGGMYYGYCTTCGKQFSGTTKASVSSQGLAHYNATGHRWNWL